MRILKFFIVFGLLGLGFSDCKPTQQESLEKWAKQTEIPQAQEMDELSRLCFEHSYRESSWDPQSHTLTIEYGGSSALTFSSANDYIPMTILDLAKKSYRTYYYGSTRGLKILRVSLVKPFYTKNAKNPETEIQEFEVYRMRIDPATWSELGGKDLGPPFEVDSYNVPVGNFKEALEKLVSRWSVELNELPRIEVK